MDTQKKLEIIKKSCEDKLGIDIKILDIKRLSSVADYFVIVSGNSSNQVRALADEIEDKMAEAKEFVNNKEGQNSMRWILLDYGDIIVHVFHRDEREYYNLERLWDNENQKEEK